MKKINFKKGIGELLEAAITLPIILFMLGFLINLFQIAQCEQRLIYSTYFCGRAACVAYDQNEAKTAIDNTLAEIVSDGSLQADIQVNGAWMKGNFVVVTVSQNLNPVFGVGKGLHSRRIAIMIEHSKWITE